MGLINRLHTFATMPGISPDIGSKIDQEINTLFNAVNGNLDDSNIDGSPAIQSSKLSLGGAGFLPLAGGSLTAVLNHAFNGLWRALGATGTGLIREYRYGNTVWGISYNTLLDTNGIWQGRDISDICLRVELTKTSDGWGGLRVYTADSLGGGVSPTWNPVQHYAPMGGHSRYHNGTAWTSIGNTTDTITVDPGVSGIFNYNNLILNANWTLQQGKPLIIIARESVTINGIIDGNGKGALGGIVNNPGANGLLGGSGGSGGSDTGAFEGKKGGDSAHLWRILGGVTTGYPGVNGVDTISTPPSILTVSSSGEILGGAGGGGSLGDAGGNGGGYIYIEAPMIIIGSAGVLKADGLNGSTGGGGDGSGGGGGGGVVHLRAKSFINNGTSNLTAVKGMGGQAGNFGGNGGAGVIYIEEYR